MKCGNVNQNIVYRTISHNSDIRVSHSLSASQGELDQHFPMGHGNFLLYTPNNSLTYKIMESLRYKMDIIEESEYEWLGPMSFGILTL